MDFNQQQAEFIHYHWLRTALILVFAGTLFTLGYGFVTDDYQLISVFVLQADNSISDQLLRAFAFFPSDIGNQQAMTTGAGWGLWFSDTTIFQWFVRPLAAFSHWLDFQLWPNHPWLMHAQNLLWLFASALVLNRFLNEIGLTRPQRLLALALFFIDSVTLWSGWLAQRNAYMTLVGMLLALIGYSRFLRHQRVTSLLAMLVALTFALLSSESGLVTSVFLAFLPLAFGQKLFTRKHLTSMVVVAVICAGFLASYVGAGFGASQHPFYVSPLSYPLQAIESLLFKFPSAFNLLPFADLAFVLEKLHKFNHLAAFYLPLCGVLVFVCYRLYRITPADSKNVVHFALASAAGALLPLTGSMTADRSVVYLKLAITIFLAISLPAALSRLPAKQGRQISSLMCGFLVIKAGALLIAAAAGLYYLKCVLPDPTAHISPESSNSQSVPPHIIYLNHQGSVYSALLLERLQHRISPDVKSAHRLISTKVPFQLTRISGNQLLLEATQGTLLTTADLALGDPSFSIGQQFNLEGIRVETQGIKNHLPTAMKITLLNPLDHYRFIIYQDGVGYSTTTLPETGNTRLIYPRNTE